MLLRLIIVIYVFINIANTSCLSINLFKTKHSSVIAKLSWL